jgi:L-ascorbate metabolism protein UlaG (beta-lactamase superfamily)
MGINMFLKFLNITVQSFIILKIFAMQACVSSPASSSSLNWEVGKPKHHTTEGFRNYPIVPESPALGIGFYMRRIESSFNLPVVPESHYLSEEDAITQLNNLKNKNTITWIGQSTFLMKIDGKFILTDPFFSKHASPFSIGPSRFVKPGISPEALPKIDIIIISHNHYDHLDEQFIESLPNKENIHVFVPLKLISFFTERGYSFVHELDWYETDSIYNFRLTALPTVHFSGRGIGDRNKSLWCAWAISTPFGKYFFIGDSAYSPTLFNEIGNNFESFDLAMLTIGTYGNRKYGVNNHTTPEEAINIGKAIKAKTLLGMHWGTIELSDESPWEPPKRFKESAQKAGFLSEKIWIMKIGETRILPGI